MQCLLVIILGIAMYGNPVASQSCYQCEVLYSGNVTPGSCTNVNFDPNDVGQVQCSGLCQTLDTSRFGLRNFKRACGSSVCGKGDGLTCCAGNLCNGQGGDAGGDVGNATGDGNQCYLCLDLAGNGCDNDNFDVAQASTVTCPGTCEKRWSSMEGEIVNSSRGCATEESGEEMECNENGCDADEIEGVTIERCKFCCQGELCNGAGSVAISNGTESVDISNGARSVAISTTVILSVTAVSALLVKIFY